ncbi:MAG: cupin domain-containing protein [Cyclobacteriaceae bacterium]
MDKYWKFIDEGETVVEKVLGRDHSWYFNPEITEQAGTFMVKVTIPTGGQHDFHRHPEMNEILYVLKGTAEQWVEDEMKMMQPGDSVYIAPDVVHGTFNAGDNDLELLAILSPSQGWEAGTLDESQNLPYSEYRKN